MSRADPIRPNPPGSADFGPPLRVDPEPPDPARPRRLVGPAEGHADGAWFLAARRALHGTPADAPAPRRRDGLAYRSSVHVHPAYPSGSQSAAASSPWLHITNAVETVVIVGCRSSAGR